MDKKSKLILLVFIFVVLLVAAYPSYRLISKLMTEYKIESRLKEKQFDNDISKKAIKFDSKTGKYVLEVRYKTEPNYTYNYEVLDGNKILTIVYDQENVEVNNVDNSLKYTLK